MKRKTTPVLERIDGLCKQEGTCKVWIGSLSAGTTPQIRVDGKPKPVRRVLWEAKHGPIPEGMKVVSTCGCSLCIHHLGLRTRGEILERYFAKANNTARIAKIAAARRRNSELSDAAVRQIREEESTGREAAAKHGISFSYASAIRLGKARRELSSPWAGL